MFYALLTAMGCSLAGAPPPDLNTAGFEAYKAGKYAEAKALFEKAQVTTPKNAWAWLNWARVVAREAQSADDAWSAGCTFETPWAMQALVALDRALTLSTKPVQKKIEADEDGALAKLKQAAEFRDWTLAWQPLPKGKAAVAALLKAHPEWHEEGGLPVAWTFAATEVTSGAPGGDEVKSTFAFEGDGIVVKRGAEREKLVLRAEPWSFDEGKKSLRRLVLTSSSRTLYLGAVATWDCAS